MESKQNSRLISRFFFLIIAVVLISVGFGAYAKYIVNQIPEEIYVLKDNTTTVNLNLPVTGENVAQTVSFNRPVTFIGADTGKYKLKIKLFGLFDVSTVSVNVVEPSYVYPCGFQIGLYLKTDGILAVSTSEFTDNNGDTVNPCDNIVQQGDYIIAVNHKKISSKTEMINMISECAGNRIVLTLRRNGQDMDVNVQPVEDNEGQYKIGLWVKDDAQGIGTVTFIDGHNHFGALGHGISDTETSSLLNIESGALYCTKIMSIVKGSNGKPGEFVGTIDYKNSNLLGTITKNISSGIYGNLTRDLVTDYSLQQMPVGYSYDVHNGTAAIRLYSGTDYKDYEIQITGTSNSESKNITFKVTSQELLDLTNGIVQGMSGCPIIQDGKIIGAVTHVFVDDSTSGYGVFIEKMLNNLSE